jgi:hypothetical protein
MFQFANRKDPYATWAETEREEFIQSLLSTIKRWAGVLIAWGIEIDDWPNEGQIAKAYTLCALAIPGHGRSLCVLFPSSFCLLRPATKSPEEPQFKAVGAVFLKKDPCRGSGRGDGVSRLVRMQTPEDVVLNLHAFHAAKEYPGVKVVRTDHGPAHLGQTRVHIAIHGINEANFLEFEHFGRKLGFEEKALIQDDVLSHVRRHSTNEYVDQRGNCRMTTKHNQAARHNNSDQSADTVEDGYNVRCLPVLWMALR